MSIGDIEALGAILLGATGVIIGLYKYFNSRISRVYERFDEYKNNIESKFVYREMCQVLHQNNSENFTKLEKRMEDGFKSVELKIGELVKIIIK